MKLLFLFILLLVFVFHTSTIAQNQHSVNVRITVSHRDKDIASEMYSYLAREIRSLGDASVVTENEDFVIRILVVDSKVGGRLVGYAVSTAVTKSALCLSITKNKDGTPNIFTYDDIFDHSVEVIPYDGLRAAAQGIVTSFDTNILEERRKIFQGRRRGVRTIPSSVTVN